MRRGAVEIQFNWVFVLIAGSVILLAFFSFILKQKAASDQAMAESLVKDVQFLAEGAASASKAWQTIEGTKKPIEAVCSEDCSCTLNVGSFSQDFRDLSLFIPSELSGAKLIFWSQDWSMPFRATNFLYMSSQDVKYWLVYQNQDDPLLEDITSIFPEDLVMETIPITQIGDIESEDFEVVKIIFVNSGFYRDTELARQLDASFEEVQVKAVLVDDQRQELTFYEKMEEDELVFVEKKMPYAGLATVLGAIFANDANMYGCQVEKGLRRAESVIRVYAERTKDLNDANLEGCSYQQATTNLQSMVQSTGTLSLGIEGQQMRFPIDNLDQINRDLLNQGCPLVY